MSWLSLVAGLVKVAQAITQWLAQRELIDAGKAIEANGSLNRALEMLDAAKRVDQRFGDLDAAARERLRERHTRPS